MILFPIALLLAAVLVSCAGKTEQKASGRDGTAIPSYIPGFAPADLIRYYGLKENPGKDGTVFDYINGGALVYLNHGLVGITHALFYSEDGDELVVDLFDMAAPDSALAAFRDEEICPEAFELPEVGAEVKAYNYAPDYMLYAVKSRYLVFLSTTNDEKKGELLKLAQDIIKAIE